MEFPAVESDRHTINIDDVDLWCFFSLNYEEKISGKITTATATATTTTISTEIKVKQHTLGSVVR